jgi:alkaline phosphatase
VEQFVAQHPSTLVISTADHGTGGISTGRGYVDLDYPPYEWYPEYLFKQIASASKIAKAIENGADIASTLQTYTAIQATRGQIDYVKYSMTANNTRANWVAIAVGDVVAETALIGWTTPGHVGVDVSLFAFGQGSNDLRGLYENTAIGQYVIDMFNFDVASITNQLSYVPSA